MKKYQIAVLTPTLDQGGAERSMVQLSIGLYRAGCSVELVTALNSKGVYRSEVPLEVPLLDLSANRIRYLPKELYRYLTEHKPDIVITALINNWVLGVAALAGYRGKIIISERTVFSKLLEEQKGLSSLCKLFFSKKLYPRADRIVAVSEGVKDDLLHLQLGSNEQVRVIYNPVVSARFFEMVKAESPLPLLALDRPNFIAVGRLSEAKNYPLLLRAFARLRKKIPCRLVLLGEGEQRSQLESLVVELGLSDDAVLPGFVQNPFPYVAAADCFVMSSNREGLPGALIQALACGTTVVSTNCESGPSEILENGKYGFLVPMEDEEAFAKAMQRALENPFDRKLLKERAQFFSEENCVNAYLKLFKEFDLR